MPARARSDARGGLRLGLALLAGGDSADAKLELELDPSLAETKDKAPGSSERRSRASACSTKLAS
jgi:hypothetical protein